MKRFKVFYIFILLFYSLSIIGQDSVLYEPFELNMFKAEAINLLKKNRKRFKSIPLGSGNIFSLRKGSLNFEAGKLYSVTIWSKKNLVLRKAEAYLKNTRKHLESKGFVMVYAQEYWDKPLQRDKNKPCIRFVNKEKKILLDVESRGQGNVYNVFLNYYNLTWFNNKAKRVR